MKHYIKCLLLGTVIISGPAYAAECTSAPDCAALGYTMTASDCGEKAYIKCPFDTSKIFCQADIKCTVANCAACKQGSGTQCAVCKSGYELNGTTCRKSCSSGYSRSVTSCNSNYCFSQDIAGCGKCTYKNNCSGYYFSREEAEKRCNRTYGWTSCSVCPGETKWRCCSRGDSGVRCMTPANPGLPLR